MKITLDIKSLLLGVTLGVVALFVTGAGLDSNEQAGKYQAATDAGFCIIVDTSTGQAWGANLASPAPGYQRVAPGFWERKDGGR